MTQQLATSPSPNAGPHADKKRRRGAKRGSKRGANRVVAILIMLAGVCLLLYPVAATWIQNKMQSNAAQSYTQQIQDNTTAEQRRESLERAHQWNTDHAQGPILDPWLARVDKSNTEYAQYLKQLDLQDVMARVKIPSINSDLPVYHGTDQETLSRGVGHLFGSSLPVGGDGTHAVLTGHTGLANATLWDNLTKVKKGDAFYINVSGETLKYQVDDIRVVLPEQTDNLRPVPGQDLITLITCTPYGVNSHRLLVTGKRVPMDPKEAEDVLNSGSVPLQWWQKLAIAAAAVVLLVLLWWMLRARKKRSQAAQAVGKGEDATTLETATTPRTGGKHRPENTRGKAGR
ncbi:class C sortase [Corynebacterium heidelbergense]|nr:class C sortase [Corynebacterium heidelbergense]WCZ35713.1 Sortase family protein [Corynebacterium heidelbergense]